MIYINPQAIAKEYDLHKITAQILHSRGYDEKWKIDKFTNPSLNNLSSPSSLPKAKEIKNEIMKYVEFDDPIMIMGDYDVDGVIATTVFYKTLEKLNANTHHLIGNRFKDGYGLSKRMIDEAIKYNVELIITVDMGISEHENIKYANENGIEVIVFDHHEHNNPPSTLFMDLKVNQGSYSFDKLSAAGLVWQFCRYLTNDNLYSMLDLVTLSTVADLVPLYGDNRIIVKEGLKKMKKTYNIGLKELIIKQDKLNEEISTGDIGYKIAPMINAQGRLYDNNKSARLLITKDEKVAKNLASDLYKANERRKELTEKGLELVKENVDEDDNFIIVQGDFGKGIVGVIAGDIQDEHKKPVIVFGKENKEGICKGSARSYSPLHIRELLEEVSDLLEKFGGHKQAAGLSIKKKNLKEFKKRILEKTKDIEYDTMSYDLEISPKKIETDLIKEMDIFNPCGIGNPSPKFNVNAIPTNINIVGKNNNHYKFELNGIDCIAFGKADKDLGNEFIVSLSLNNWNGITRPQMQVREIIKQKKEGD